MDSSVMEPFRLEVQEATIADLQSRLERTRWPDQLPGTGWERGADLRTVQELCRYWETSFDWQAFVARRNRYAQLVTEIDGQRIHAIHAVSPEPAARPLLLTHGWPGSVAEFDEVIGPLVDPASHGGEASDAFHVVAPSLPGYGFSGPTLSPGWDGHRIARAFAELMSRLGYGRFFAQGGDWGSMVSMSLAGQFPDRVAGVHVNLLMVPPPPEEEDPVAGLDETDRALVARVQRFLASETAYQAIQATKPQSLAYGMTDSPAGLAAWVLEKFHTWSDCGDDVLAYFTPQRLLENISIYWLTGTINSSFRLYHETLGPGFTPGPPVRVPVGHAVYPAEVLGSPRAWAERTYDIVHWSVQSRGGHFAAMEVPEAFLADVRDCFRKVDVA